MAEFPPANDPCQGHRLHVRLVLQRAVPGQRGMMFSPRIRPRRQVAPMSARHFRWSHCPAQRRGRAARSQYRTMTSYAKVGPERLQHAGRPDLASCWAGLAVALPRAGAPGAYVPIAYTLPGRPTVTGVDRAGHPVTAAVRSRCCRACPGPARRERRRRTCAPPGTVAWHDRCMPRQGAALWRCPRCGHEFVTAHMWHSCSSHALG